MISDIYHVINEPTSATMTVLIGDLCTSNDDCAIENSYCASGICVCKETFSESVDRQSCSGLYALDEEYWHSEVKLCFFYFWFCISDSDFGVNLFILLAEGITLAIKQRGCASSPCRNNAECVDKPNGQYLCVCSAMYNGTVCENFIKHGKLPTNINFEVKLL